MTFRPSNLMKMIVTISTPRPLNGYQLLGVAIGSSSELEMEQATLGEPLRDPFATEHVTFRFLCFMLNEYLIVLELNSCLYMLKPLSCFPFPLRPFIPFALRPTCFY